MKNSSDSGPSEEERAEWIETYQKINEYHSEESLGTRKKMVAKIKQNPFVPIGIVATTIALTAGILSMKSGNKRRSQLMMRARVACQGFTIAALLVGIVVAAKTKSTES